MKPKGICEKCKKEYEYEYNPKYPRKYCHECSAEKKKAFNAGITANGTWSGTSTDGESKEETLMEYQDGDGLELTPVKPGMIMKDSYENEEFQIKSRQCRSNALASAIEHLQGKHGGFDMDEVLTAAKVYEKYIVTGE